ncbi:arylsulfatase [Verrucomicrobiaceae bacterium N1E253]|uniref:Arylsulfatase n=1 Tax=Oceaniferula marina TaxID=2748318 RepID=A0A851GFJ7_9BACT|nr:arylsulfatase [Oceaniferula marina]NWK56538.1 arylsulfatase [Oceaniferula marina]
MPQLHLLALTLLITLGLTAIAPASHPAATTERPNVILILADDLGAGMLGHNGQKIVTTPHIDRLAAEGISLTNHYGNTYCAPARWSLLTGMHNGRKGSGSQAGGGALIKLDQQNLSPEAWDTAFKKIQTKARPIPDNEVFLAQIAQQAGYHTAEFGKLDIGFLTWNTRLQRHGWDHHFGFYDHVRAHGFFPPYLWKNGQKIKLPGNKDIRCGKMSERGNDPVGSGGTTYSQDVFDREIINYIRQQRSERFFLYHPSQLPHGPVAVTELHPDFATRKDLTLSEKKYATMVKSLDNTVGKIMAELKRLDLDKKTIVFFSSDNGHETYYQNAQKQLPKHLWRSGKLADGSKSNVTDKKWRGTNGGDIFNGNGGRAGLKWSTWQGGVHCPMIVRWPEKIQPGSRTSHLSAHYDFMPTLADIVGSQQPENKDGISYLPKLLGRNQPNTHDWIFIQNTGPRSLSALITRKGYKLIQLKDKSYQLYHILKDPGEHHNIAKQHPELVKQLIPVFETQQNSGRPDLQSYAPR